MSELALIALIGVIMASIIVPVSTIALLKTTSTATKQQT